MQVQTLKKSLDRLYASSRPYALLSYDLCTLNSATLLQLIYAGAAVSQMHWVLVLLLLKGPNKEGDYTCLYSYEG